MECRKCGATIALVSGKGGGYYGCLGAAKGSCDNTMLVRRCLLEEVVTGAVRDRVSSAERIHYLLKRVEEEVRRLYAHVPETIRLEETERQKCFSANALPEWLLRYFSKADALFRERKAMAVSIRQGLYLEVCGTWPELCARILPTRSSLSPV